MTNANNCFSFNTNNIKRDSARHLDWFQHEEQSRGSVEKTSLSQVGNINECGIFEIGNAEKHGLVCKCLLC